IYTEKSSPYKGEFEPIGSACLAFSIKFLVAVAFLLYDLETDLLLPLP
ncbi:hypothetical protein DBR06_SOUSAS30610014, partial [Sousa chinensis]